MPTKDNGLPPALPAEPPSPSSITPATIVIDEKEKETFPSPIIITTEPIPGANNPLEPDEKANPSTPALRRQLSGRHLNFIAIGGTIGTGFFLGMGPALARAGPAGCLLAFVVVGTALWAVMACLGELATYCPTAGAFSVYAGRFVDPGLGFAVGWLYWFSCKCFFVFVLVGLAPFFDCGGGVG